MFERETIVPLVLGFVVAVLVHVSAAVGFTMVQSEVKAARAVREEARADLVVEAVEISRPRVAGKGVEITMRVRNAGRLAAGAFETAVELDGRVIGRLSRDQGLVTDEGAEFRLGWVVEEAGLHRIGVWVDSGGAVKEWDEKNNRSEELAIWLDEGVAERGGSVGEVDLAVVDLEIAEERVVGQATGIRAAIGNMGGDWPGGSVVVMAVDGREVGRAVLEGRWYAGEIRTWSGEVVVDEAGRHAVSVRVEGRVGADGSGAAAGDVNSADNQMTETAVWREESEEIPVGDDTPSPLVMNWVSYEAFEKLMTPQETDFDQATAQREVDPVEVERIPLDPTPPGARSAAAPATSAAQRAEETEAPRLMVAETEIVGEAAQPVETGESEGVDATQAPMLAETRADLAAAPVQGEPVEASRIVGTGDDAERPNVAVDETALADERDSVPFAGRPERVVRAERPVVEVENGEDAELSEVVDGAVSQDPELIAPVAEVVEGADAEDASMEVVADEREEVTVVALNVPVDSGRTPGSPEDEEPTREVDANLTRAPQRPQEDVEEVRDGTDRRRDDEARRAADSEREQQVAVLSSQAEPTVAPKEERETPPVARERVDRVKPGQVVAREGLMIQTVNPMRYIDIIALRTSIPANPRVRVTFGKDGRVLEAEVVKSTGFANWDGPILNTLYQWRATGRVLDAARGPITEEITLILYGR